LALISAVFNLDRTLGPGWVKEHTSYDLTRFFKVKTRAAGEGKGRQADLVDRITHRLIGPVYNEAG